MKTQQEVAEMSHKLLGILNSKESDFKDTGVGTVALA